jgi:PAS domain S-box-containing protein
MKADKAVKKQGKCSIKRRLLVCSKSAKADMPVREKKKQTSTGKNRSKPVSQNSIIKSINSKRPVSKRTITITKLDKKPEIKNKTKTKDQLLNELSKFNRRFARLKKDSSKQKQTEENLRKTIDKLDLRIRERTEELTYEIKDRKLFENALLLEKRRLEDVTGSVNCGLFLLNNKVRVIYANRVCEEWFGPFEKIKGELCWKLFKLKNPEKECAGLEVLRTGNTVRSEAFMKAVAGEDRFFYVVASPVKDSNGKVCQITEVVVDITERKLAEKALRRAHDELEQKVKERTAQLERSNKELQDFTFIASHDLQEPLRKVIAFNDLLDKKYECVLDDEANDYKNRINKAVNRMQELIDDLLALTRVATKARPFKQTDLQVVVDEVIEDLVKYRSEKGAKIVPMSLPVIDADEVQMRQLFQNLIMNALKFHRSRIPPHVHIEGRTLGTGYCEIMIKDNGIGFDMKYADLIFKPFQRLYNRKEFKGSGIGLSICKKIIERHGGDIYATSSPGKGSVFVMKLPFSQPVNEEVSYGK